MRGTRPSRSRTRGPGAARGLERHRPPPSHQARAQAETDAEDRPVLREPRASAASCPRARSPAIAARAIRRPAGRRGRRRGRRRRAPRRAARSGPDRAHVAGSVLADRNLHSRPFVDGSPAPSERTAARRRAPTALNAASATWCASRPEASTLIEGARGLREAREHVRGHAGIELELHSRLLARPGRPGWREPSSIGGTRRHGARSPQVVERCIKCRAERERRILGPYGRHPSRSPAPSTTRSNPAWNASSSRERRRDLAASRRARVSRRRARCAPQCVSAVARIVAARLPPLRAAARDDSSASRLCLDERSSSAASQHQMGIASGSRARPGPDAAAARSARARR